LGLPLVPSGQLLEFEDIYTWSRLVNHWSLLLVPSGQLLEFEDIYTWSLELFIPGVVWLITGVCWSVISGYYGLQ